MNNDRRDQIIGIVAADFDQLVNITNRTDDIETLLQLMCPNDLFKLLEKATIELVGIAKHLMNKCFELNYYRLSSNAKERLYPTDDMDVKILNIIGYYHNVINKTVNNYLNMYSRFIDKVEYVMEHNKTKSFGGATLGGIAAGLLFGPIGAFIGGIAGASYADSASKGDLIDRFNVLYREFVSTLDDVGRYIVDMVDRMLAILHNYEELFDGHQFIE